MKVYFKNSCGKVVFSDGSGNDFRLTELLGMGPVEKEYHTVVFSGYDGQETVTERAVSRTITLGVELCRKRANDILENFFRVLEKPGYLYIETDFFFRRIFCNQVKVSDAERILSDEIGNFAVQFVCDSPFFEDGEESIVPLYKRIKNLSSAFSLPCEFGRVSTTANIENIGRRDIEPLIRILCSRTVREENGILFRNVTTDKKIRMNYTPQENEKIEIDVKNRTVTSSIRGNIIDCLTDDSFLGDFVFVSGVNRVEASVGDAASGFMVECIFSNLYCEALVI